MQGDERRPGRMPTSVGEHREARRLRCGCPELPWRSTILWVAWATSNTWFHIAAMDQMNTRPHAVSALRAARVSGRHQRIWCPLRCWWRCSGKRCVTRAGEVVGLTQSATSNALAGLRPRFGDELLVGMLHRAASAATNFRRTLPHDERRRTIRSADSAHTGSAIPQRRRTAHAVTTECGDPLCTAGLPGGFHAER